MIMLRALGTAEIETALATLTPSQEMVFAAALYLILERGKSVSRKRLSSLLWPDAPEELRSHRLRQTILQLKKVGFAVSADRNSLQCSPKDHRSDIAEFTGNGVDGFAARESLEFLPGYSPTFSDSFRDWVDAQREEANALVTGRLVTELISARTKGDWLTCDRVARQCLTLDPFNESAVLAQAEASAMRGAKTQALEILDRYLVDVGSDNPNMRLSASVLRRRITDRVPERTPITMRESAFVGRDLEIETLTSALLAARHARGGACLVRGEAGIGKSRLASELIKFAALEGIQTSRTACRRSDVDRPLSVFVDLVPQLSELRGALGCSQQTMSVLKSLTEFDGRASFSSLSVDDAMSAHTRMRAALFDLLDALTDERCVLVVIDDVQWLDAASVKLIAALLPWAKARKILFVVTERSGMNDFAKQFAPDDLTSLTLGPLVSQFAEAIVAETLKDSSRPTTSELVQRLLSVGEGNPFFLQELGNHWLETGKQRSSPPSVTAIIDERLARLSHEALLALQACAVLGVNATIERVEGVLEYQSHVLLSAVQELSVAGMLRGETHASPESAEPLTVAHDLISTAALQRLARAPLSFLHRRAGTVIERETLGDGARTALLWACAFHWLNAGDRERAFRAACSCAEHLLTVGFSSDAVQAFERVIDYCVTDEQRLLVLSRLAKSLQMCGLWETSKAVLHKARQLEAKTGPNLTNHDELEYALLEARWRGGREDAGLLDDVKACVRSNEASVGHRVACGLMGIKIASQENQIGVLKELYFTMLPLLRNPMIPPVTRLEVEMIFHSTCGDMRIGEQAADQLLTAVREEPDPGRGSGALANVGAAYRRAGRDKDAVTVLHEALDLAVANGLISRAAYATLLLVRVHIAAGEFARAHAAMEKFDVLTQKLHSLTQGDEDRHSAGHRIYLQTMLALEEGNIQTAAELYSALARLAFREGTDGHVAVLALGVRIATQRETPIDVVTPLVAELEAVYRNTRISGLQDFEAHALATGLRYCGQSAEALRLLIEYTTTYRRERWAVPQRLSDLLRVLREDCATVVLVEGAKPVSTPIQRRAEPSRVPEYCEPSPPSRC